MITHIGPIPIYGILIMTGAVIAALYASYEVRRRGEEVEIVWDALSWIIIGGVVGARIWHILTPPESMVEAGITTQYYLTHPLDALAIWRGGLGIPGAVMGGMLMLYIFTRRRNLSFAMWADIAAPALALGQAIGRWGNFVNQELYGEPSNLPWAIFIEPQNRLPEFAAFETYHPLFLYESLWNLFNFFLLVYLGRKYGDRIKPGTLFLTYLITYPIARFFLEFIRLDASQIAGINANQTLMLFVIVLAGNLIWYRERKKGAN